MRTLRVALVGDFSHSRDEGYKNVSHSLADAVERHEDIALNRIDGKRLGSRAMVQSYIRSRPDVVHIVAQPSTSSLVLAEIIGGLPPRPRVVISALRSESVQSGLLASRMRRALWRLSRPDLLLVQDRIAQSRFRAWGFRVAIVPNGVDPSRFRPGTLAERTAIRDEMGLEPGRPVVVHVGHLQAARRLESLLPLVDAGIQVLVVGSTYLGADGALVARLHTAGVRVIVGFVPDVERVYRMADCYVFPVEVSRSLTTPLSVLEALAAGIPVVTTRFPGLEHLFPRERAVTFVDDVDRILSAVQGALGTPSDECRALVADLSWDDIAAQAITHYRDLVGA